MYSIYCVWLNDSSLWMNPFYDAWTPPLKFLCFFWWALLDCLQSLTLFWDILHKENVASGTFVQFQGLLAEIYAAETSNISVMTNEDRDGSVTLPLRGPARILSYVLYCPLYERIQQTMLHLMHVYEAMLSGVDSLSEGFPISHDNLVWSMAE